MSTFTFAVVLILLLCVPLALYGAFSLTCLALKVLANPLFILRQIPQVISKLSNVAQFTWTTTKQGGTSLAKQARLVFAQQVATHLSPGGVDQTTGNAKWWGARLYLQGYQAIASLVFGGLPALLKRQKQQQNVKSTRRRPRIRLTIKWDYREIKIQLWTLFYKLIFGLESLLKRLQRPFKTPSKPFFVKRGGFRETKLYTSDTAKRDEREAIQKLGYQYFFGVERTEMEIKHGYVGRTRSKKGRYQSRPKTKIVENTGRMIELDD